jgi:hypothetical protein
MSAKAVTARVSVEEIETTKSEKLLAVVLAVFLLIGGLWAYGQLDDSARASVDQPQATASESLAITRLSGAANRLAAAQERERQALEELAFAREAYRTALDAGAPAGPLERRYEAAQATRAEAQAALRDAEAAVGSAEPAAHAAESRIARAQQDALDRAALLSFALRFAFVAFALASAYALLARLRRRNSRYLPLALAAVGFAALLAFVMAGDYATDYVDPLDMGLLVLSLLGIGLTVVSFVALQRYLARRVPLRRVRKGECPFCGYPVRGNEHCEGCGRDVVAECARCAAPRRVGALHCGACGQA